MKGPTKVGVSELRRNLSKYLKQARVGEAFIITKWGQEIALLVPPDSAV